MKKSVFATIAILLITLLIACNPGGGNGPAGSDLSAVRGKLNANKPYDAYHHGLFDNQTYSSNSVNASFSLTKDLTVTWSAYIPSNFEVKSSVYVILVPDDTKASDFARSEIGMEWIELAGTDEDPFAVVFVEAQDGGKWNIAESEDGRNETDAAMVLFTGIRDKAAATNAFISVDKSGVRLLGYEEGAVAAALWASSWPQLFANTTLIEPTEFPSDAINKHLGSTIYPVAIDSANGYDLGIKARSVAMPMFLFGDESIVKSYESLWKGINASCTNPDSSRDKSLEVVKVLADSSASTIYDNAKQNNRFLGYPGGTIRGVFGAYKGEGFHPVWEEKIDGYVRRWIVYTPKSYDGETAVPLVVALHGSSASVTDLPEESRWTDIADDEGFIVVFIQGYPAGDPNPIPSWFSLDGGAQTDIDYLKTVVGKVQEEYNIDSSKMYLTGHSMGSMMTQCFAASDDRDFFAAYGPVGYALPGGTISALFADASIDETNTVVVPMWFHKGEWDLNGNKIDGSQGGDTEAFKFWAETVNNLSSPSSAKAESGSYHFGSLPSNKFVTTTYSSGSAPVVKYTQVSQSPHTYMPEESELLWSWFDCWSRGENGEALYNGTEVSITR